MEHRLHFIVAALGRDCDHFVLHIYASLAEQERKMISECTKAGLARSKKKLGFARRSKAYQRRIGALGVAAIHKAAKERAGGLSRAHRVGAATAGLAWEPHVGPHCVCQAQLAQDRVT
jgi:DNA invertase Pin-like site-specific DNA recombinase